MAKCDKDCKGFTVSALPLVYYFSWCKGVIAMDVKRREALKKLAALSAYSAPAVTALLTPQRSYAQTSEALNSPQNEFNNQVNACVAGEITNLPGNTGNNATGSSNNDDISDCNRA